MKKKNNIIGTINVVSEQLQNQELETVKGKNEWKSLMQMYADDINTCAGTATTESEIAFEFDRLLVNHSKMILEPNGYDGYQTQREKKVTLIDLGDGETKIQLIKPKTGRIDSKYSNVVIEYKHPTKYSKSNPAKVIEARKQAISYLKALNAERKGNYVALVTDGIKCQYIEYIDGIDIPEDAQDVHDLNGEYMDILINAIINLQIKPLASENLIRDLVEEKHNGVNIINKVTMALYNSLEEMSDATKVDFAEWKDNFGLSDGDVSQQKAIEDRRKDLGLIINKETIGTDDEYLVLYALQTATAIIAMLIAYKVISIIRGNKNLYSMRYLLSHNQNTLRIELSRMSNGSVSSELQIYNILELGYFSWAFQEEHWTEEIYQCIKETIEVLSRYENMPDMTEKTDDLFRDLFMSIMPTSVRHSLGEYYTQSWLAEETIEDAKTYISYERPENLRVLDSTCGSGTFIQKVIEQKRKKYKNETASVILNNILNEVVGIDANLLAVILARINYFIAIVDLIGEDQEIYIPIFMGDSSIPYKNKKTNDGKYYVDRIKTPTDEVVELMVPCNSLGNKSEFIDIMRKIDDFAAESDEELSEQLHSICKNDIDYDSVISSWLELRNMGMITTAIINSIINYFLLCEIGKFDILVGNPPWVDWKSLPSVHRENKKDVCYERDLFSGDGRTGGNSLNICALISNVSAENWLNKGGVMALLMPQSLLFQQSYEGYRKFKLMDNRTLYFQKIKDWSKAGHPFYPVQQLFCTYILSEDEQDYNKVIPLELMILKKGYKLEKINSLINHSNFKSFFSVDTGVLGCATENRSAFTYAKNEEELKAFQTIAGESLYIGREGVEYYPQELQLFKLVDETVTNDLLKLETYKNSRSKYSIGIRKPKLETKYLRPLVKGVGISRFHIEPSEYLVAFPYDKEHAKIPIDKKTLRSTSPNLFKYYRENEDYLRMQTKYSDSIIGDSNAEYYALARTGIYSHAPWYVVFRDNTKWVAAVAGKIDTKWGGKKIPAFQNHCVSICERKDGSFIKKDEAHYICAILNSHIVEDYILATSDKRTFKIRVPVKIERYDNKNKIHKSLSKLSQRAHKLYKDDKAIEAIRFEIDRLYVESLK